MYSRKRIGPRTDPCGTLDKTGAGADINRFTGETDGRTDGHRTVTWTRAARSCQRQQTVELIHTLYKGAPH